MCFLKIVLQHVREAMQEFSSLPFPRISNLTLLEDNVNLLFSSYARHPIKIPSFPEILVSAQHNNNLT